MKNDIASKIKSLSFELLADSSDQAEVQRILNEIHGYFKELTNISGFDMEIKNMAAVPTVSGMALGLNHAAQCLLDYKRTAMFLKGVVTAIRDKQKQYPGETINMFYAGCGPYAPFVTMVAPLFQPEEIQFTLLEINKNSVASVKKLIEGLELTDYVKTYYSADAVTFKIPEPESFHILFSETLDALLYRESYVPILWNMLPQLSEDVAVIPKNVCVEMNFRVSEGELGNATLVEKYAGNIFDTRQALQDLPEMKERPIQFPPKEFGFEPTINYKSMILDTEVHVYDDLILKRGESSLTLPFEMTFDPTIKNKEVVFTYFLQPQVELKCDFK